MKSFRVFLGAAIIGTIAFFITDCSVGTSTKYDCTVKGRSFKASWNEVLSSIDADGNVSIDTIHHPEEYHLFCEDLETWKIMDVNTTAANYAILTNGQVVLVKARKGKWTGINYLSRISNVED